MIDASELIRGSDLPEHEAVRLLAVATTRSIADVRVGFPIDDPEALATFQALAGRRRTGEPLQYLEGDVPFGGATISVDDRVLIPRPETEEILETVDRLGVQPRSIVDLCTGSGALAIALALRHPEATVHATDVDPDALACAASNVDANGVAVQLHEGDLFGALPAQLAGSIDLIVSNPPYVTLEEYEQVPPDVAREPRHALVSGPTGTEFVDRIGRDAATWLAPGGLVICEISEFRSGEAVIAFDDLDGAIEHDVSGAPRFVLGRRRFE